MGRHGDGKDGGPGGVSATPGLAAPPRPPRMPGCWSPAAPEAPTGSGGAMERGEAQCESGRGARRQQAGTTEVPTATAVPTGPEVKPEVPSEVPEVPPEVSVEVEPEVSEKVSEVAPEVPEVVTRVPEVWCGYCGQRHARLKRSARNHPDAVAFRQPGRKEVRLTAIALNDEDLNALDRSSRTMTRS